MDLIANKYLILKVVYVEKEKSSFIRLDMDGKYIKNHTILVSKITENLHTNFQEFVL